MMVCCSTFVKVTALVCLTIVAIVGCVLIWIGAVDVFQVSYDHAEQDGLQTLLSNFTSCSDKSVPDMSSDYNQVLQNQCSMIQAPYLALYCLGGVFSLFATIFAVVSAVKGGRISAYSFAIFSAVSMSLLFVGIIVMAQTTNRVASRMLLCGNYDADTISALEKSGFVCIEGSADGRKITGLKWLKSILVYYIGASCTLFSLVAFLVLNSWCRSSRTFAAERAPLTTSRAPLTASYYSAEMGDQV